MTTARQDAIVGCLVGTAVGDAVGLAVEGLSTRRQRVLFPSLDGPQLFFRQGTISDDTEHACMTAQAFIESAGDPARFEASLARRLKRWLICLPPGVGFATLRACAKLWLGISPSRSGVFSAGNGPAMRATILGAACADDLSRLQTLVHVSTRITHCDPRAEYGAFAIALAGAVACRRPPGSPSIYFEALRQLPVNDSATELLAHLHRADECLRSDLDVRSFAQQLGLARGVTGYINHSVPVALYAWFRHSGDFQTAVLETVRCGGDTDTTAAIVGGLVGSSTGEKGIPSTWKSRVIGWPMSINWIENLGKCLTDAITECRVHKPPEVSSLATCARNLAAFPIILSHGLRRLLPPY